MKYRGLGCRDLIVHFFQRLAEVLKLLRAVLLAGAVEIVHERLHPHQTGVVKPFQMLSAANRNAPDPQAGSSTEMLRIAL